MDFSKIKIGDEDPGGKKSKKTEETPKKGTATKGLNFKKFSLNVDDDSNESGIEEHTVDSKDTGNATNDVDENSSIDDVPIDEDHTNVDVVKSIEVEIANPLLDDDDDDGILEDGDELESGNDETDTEVVVDLDSAGGVSDTVFVASDTDLDDSDADESTLDTVGFLDSDDDFTIDEEYFTDDYEDLAEEKRKLEAARDGLDSEDAEPAPENEEFEGDDSEAEPFRGLVNPLLDDDDDDELVPHVGENSPKTPKKIAKKTSKKSKKTDVTVLDFPGREPGVSVSRKAKGAKKHKKLSPEEKKANKERRRLEKNSTSTTYRKSLGDLDGTISQRGAKEYLVNDEGVLITESMRRRLRKRSADNFERLIQAAETERDIEAPDGHIHHEDTVVTDKTVKGDVIYPWAKPTEVEVLVDGDVKSKRRVNSYELEFYRNLGMTKTAALRGELDKMIRVNASAAGPRVQSTAGKAISKAVGGSKSVARNTRNSGFSLRDYDYILFLAKFKYASAKHLSNLHGVKEATATSRLKKLKMKGLTERVEIWGSNSVWILTSAGMLLSGYDLPLIYAGHISHALIAHQFVVNNTASNLMGGGANVLNLSDFPEKNRTNSEGKKVFGEEIISETEVQSSFSKIRLLQKSKVYRPIIMNNIERAFRDWEEGKSEGDGPETLPGNEYMWILYPPFNLQTNYHIPDIVIKRPRGPNGEPRSIAIEVELNPKATDRYERILNSYKLDRSIYGKVIWVCKNLQPAKAIEKTSKAIGLWQEDRIDVVPIITREGLFEGRSLWTI